VWGGVVSCIHPITANIKRLKREMPTERIKEEGGTMKKTNNLREGWED